ncbi:MAG: hypothetical protein C0620_04695 [Desulfuromonas sp.]|nr:MAG: hypothetical protein C0620_04695 [Desulfuromonas sp.]
MINAFHILFCRCLAVIFLCMLASCAAPPSTTMAPRPVVTPWTTVDVFYGTNRKATGEVGPNHVFGTQLGDLRYGVCQVTIPATHAPGEIERPEWYKFEFSEDPVKHVTIRTLRHLSRDEFATLFSVARQEMNTEDILIFIHGFSNTFDESVRRTGQLCYDLGFPGIAMTYSWPSQGAFSVANYYRDEDYVRQSIPYLKQFLLDVVRNADGARINIIAHSMGNRLMTRTIAEIEKEAPQAVFNQIILAAPDVDAKVFKEDIFPRMAGKARHFTLYASSDDKALMASRVLHDQSRLGESGEFLTIVPGLDTIDSTGVDPSTLGHSYYSSTRTLLNDIHDLMIESVPPEKRYLRHVPGQPAAYWQMVFDSDE